MATKSILKTIHVKERSVVNALVGALENAKGKQAKDVFLSRSCSDMSRQDIKKIFGSQEAK